MKTTIILYCLILYKFLTEEYYASLKKLNQLKQRMEKN